MPLFDELSLTLNIAVFALLAAAVWLAGTRLTYLADALGARLGVGHAIMGLIFLAGLTELPEIVTTATAAIFGDATLALNNMFGGITMQTAILAIADVVAFRVTLTAFPRKPTTILEGTFLVLLLTATLLIVHMGDRALYGSLGLGPVLLAGGYLCAISILRIYDDDYAWRPVAFEDPKVVEQPPERTLRHLSKRALALQSAGVAAVILVAGILLVEVAQNLAVQSGLGSSFVGVTLLAATTSLPELSTTVAAVRMHAYTMAISNILGSNLIMVLVILPADLLYASGEILREADTSAQLALLFGIAVTAIYLIGLLVKKKPRIAGMGLDSITVLVVYAFSLYALYRAR